jgi:hypothetical protein
MLDYLHRHTVPITLAVSFYVAGFFATANVLRLSDRDIVVGLVAGCIAGVTILASILWQEHKTGAVPVSSLPKLF